MYLCKKVIGLLGISITLAGSNFAMEDPNSSPSIIMAHGEDSSSNEAAMRVIRLIKSNNQAGKPTVLGLATGGTMVPVYQAIVRAFKSDPSLDLSDVTTFNLDAYIGLNPAHPASYHRYMYENLFVPELIHSSTNPRGIKQENIHIPDGWIDPSIAVDQKEKLLQDRVATYEQKLKDLGPIDLQLLGIGENAHIGFAEPGAPFDGRTTIVKLTESTRRANARFFANDLSQVPTRAISMGIGTILEAKEIVLLATGERKALAIANAIEGKKGTHVPATALRGHSHAIVIIDEAAGSKLKKS